MENRYLVTVFVGGKCADTFYSTTLDELVTIRAIHKDCEISVFDYESCSILSSGDVEAEVSKSRIRMQQSMNAPPDNVSPPKKQVGESPRKIRKNWVRLVRVPETGRIFRSVMDCSRQMGIPYMTIMNCINRHTATRGFHFVYVGRDSSTDGSMNI